MKENGSHDKYPKEAFSSMFKKLLLKKHKSLMPYLFICCLAIILPLNIICVFLMNELIQTWQEYSSAELKSILSSYMSQIDNSLYTASRNLNQLSDDSLFLYIQKSGQTSSIDQYTLLRAQYHTFILFQDWLTADDLCSGYFFYREKDQLSIIRLQRSSEAGTFKTYLKDDLFNALTTNAWCTVSYKGNLYAYYIKQEYLSYYGAWFDLSNLLENLKITDQSKIQYELSNTETQLNTNTFQKSDLTNLYLGASLQAHEQMSWMDRSMPIFLLLATGTLLTFPVICIILYLRIIKPIRQLQSAIYRMKNGELTYRIPSQKSSYSEFQQLNEAFNQVLETINNLKTKTYEMKIAQHEIKIKYLSQQIQPHFILNALNILYCYGPEQYSQMQEMILCLTKYFRYIVSASAAFISLSQELSHLENYLRIQNIRYQNCINVLIDFDPRLAKLKIPPLSIQPFVENSVKYAISPSHLTQISVQAFILDHQSAVIQISDSGPGFPKNILEQINLFIKYRQIQPDLGVGICNTIERLDLLYEKKAVIHILNKAEAGALIEIIVPISLINREDDSL